MIELWKFRSRIAKAERVDDATTLSAPDLFPGELGLFYFGNITLEPVVAFEHIAGAALIGFLDRCSIHGPDLTIHDLRYVHGQSEVMKGRPKITSVLLARTEEIEAKEAEWPVLIPEIWHRYQGLRAQRSI
jgi:hypothetical protein